MFFIPEDGRASPLFLSICLFYPSTYQDRKIRWSCVDGVPVCVHFVCGLTVSVWRGWRLCQLVFFSICGQDVKKLGVGFVDLSGEFVEDVLVFRRQGSGLDDLVSQVERHGGVLKQVKLDQGFSFWRVQGVKGYEGQGFHFSKLRMEVSTWKVPKMLSSVSMSSQGEGGREDVCGLGAGGSGCGGGVVVWIGMGAGVGSGLVFEL